MDTQEAGKGRFLDDMANISEATLWAALGRVVGTLKDLQQLPNGHFAVHVLPQGQVEADLIVTHPPYPLLVQVSGGFEFGDDPADGPLGQPQGRRDFPRRDLAPLHNQDQHRPVISDEMPFCHTCARGSRWDLTTAE